MCTQQSGPLDYRFGSKADIALGLRHVRFNPRKQTSFSTVAMSLCAQQQTFRQPCDMIDMPGTCASSRAITMKLPRRRFLRVAAGAAAISAASGIAEAEVYPSRTITMIVPLPPGVGTDTLTRILAEHMRGTLGQSIIVENITGAGGTIGTAHVARAAPDGYTLSVGNIGTHVISPATYPNIQYHR